MGTKQPSKYACCSVGNAFLQPIQETYKEADPSSKASSDEITYETAIILSIGCPFCNNIGNAKQYCLGHSVSTAELKSLYYDLEPAVDIAKLYRVIDALRRPYDFSISVRNVLISSFDSSLVHPQQHSFINSIISTLSNAVELSHIRMPRF